MPNWLIKTLLYFFLLIGFGLLVAVFLTIWKEDRIAIDRTIDWNYAKNLGEFSGFIAISWSVLGVLLIYLTLNYQKTQFKANSDFIEKQQFETTFFNMLNVLFNIKQAIKGSVKSLSDSSSNRYQGQEFVEAALLHFREIYFDNYNVLPANSPIKVIIGKVKENSQLTATEVLILKEDLNSIYLNFYGNYHSELGHYFRYLFNLMKFTINHRTKFGDENDYINLIQAQLSNDELALVFYNAISDNGLNSRRESRFYDWLEKYKFLENIDSRSLLLREHHVIYKTTAFKFLNSDERKLKIPAMI